MKKACDWLVLVGATMTVVGCFVIRFSTPELTETQLFLKWWGFYLNAAFVMFGSLIYFVFRTK